MGFASIILPLIKRAMDKREPEIAAYVHNKLADNVKAIKENGSPSELAAIVDSGKAFLSAVKEYVYSPNTPNI